MSSFQRNFPDIAQSSSSQGWLTSILQLGGWAGALSAGVLCEIFSRKHTIFGGAVWVILGSYLTAGAANSSYLYAGRFFTGIGVGTLSATGPLYNAELAPPEIRGLLIAMQQLATTIGILSAYWICYGTNYIGGTGDGQSAMAWRLPLIIQGIPAVVLAVGVWFLPYSPRLLMKHHKDDDALNVLSRLRKLPADDEIVQIEYLEIKSESLFEEQNLAKKYPNIVGNSWKDRLLRELAQYSLIFSTKDAFKRVALGALVMFFQQWSGIDSTTGVVGIINVVTTVPAILIIDKVGRKALLICGSIGMFACQLITGIIVAKFQHDWEGHVAAGWAAVVMIWLYIMNFAYSWGPASWTLIAEIFPLSIRAKGTSISASSNWMNNFVIAFITPPMLSSITWGTYIFFCVWCAIGGLFIFFFFPETKGKTLEEMDVVFGATTSSDDMAALRLIQEQVGLTAILQGEDRTKETQLTEVEHAKEDAYQRV
ncbi:Solute carrier 2 (Facilitated glucose transporter) member 8 [Aspergillus nanangensis]|uniref:Solute carrier 2 (Facilitated glucose transporter) member 8 n=1 Tax=Aspergillus nanangensis TaxID=2582783 RepID=A0AAD4CL02_ASPNN|nr:Solute carrier 2 (Facilitated glucose transporter) member 8 [Aspergillus nanangensis]